jgi:hypothetical protein
MRRETHYLFAGLPVVKDARQEFDAEVVEAELPAFDCGCEEVRT